MIKIIYLILVHLLLIIFLFKSSTLKQFFNNNKVINPYYMQMTAFQQRIDLNLGRELNIFIGDSLIQGLAVNSVITDSVNYGIGGDTTLGVLKRLQLYRSIITSKRVVLAIGHNDLYDTSLDKILGNFKQIINNIPINVEVFICSIFLIDESIVKKLNNSEINELNYKIKDLTHNYSNVSYINTNQWAAPLGTLDAKYHIGDGIHLNRLGNNQWIKQFKEVFDAHKIKK